MDKEDVVSKVIDTIRQYGPPQVTMEDSIDLTVTNVLAQKIGKPATVEASIIANANKYPNVEKTDEIVFGVTVKLFDVGRTFLVLFMVKDAKNVLNKQPDPQSIDFHPVITDKTRWVLDNSQNAAWYRRAIVIMKTTVEPMDDKEWETPDTD